MVIVRVYSFSIKKELTTKTHEATRRNITNFLLLVRVVSWFLFLPSRMNRPCGNSFLGFFSHAIFDLRAD